MLGFLLLDKPKDITSFFVVKILKKLANEKRIGFAGTLDPLATGLMILGLGEATKFFPYLEKLDKVYEVTATLGMVSDSYDAKGEIVQKFSDESIAKSKERLSRSLIEKILEDQFLGERMQIPPIYSAIQIDGKRAYDLARKGKKVDLKARKVSFYDLEVLSYAWPNLRLRVHCSSGTYVRSLVHDLGEVLGAGAYVSELRRTKIGHFKIQDAVMLEDLEKNGVLKFLKKVEEIFSDFKSVNLNEDQYKLLCNGGLIDLDKSYGKGPILAIYESNCVGIIGSFMGKYKFDRKINL